MDVTGTLDEALDRLHRSGPERLGRLTNHAPMAVEALAARGRAHAVHRWLDRYARKLEEFPSGVERVTSANWRAALGDPSRAADWIAFFGHELSERPWQTVLGEWWTRLLPGLCGGSTHPVIRVGHAVRTLRSGASTEPRLAELAHGLGYWAARQHRVAALTPLPGAGRAAVDRAAADRAAAALDLVPRIAVQDGGFPARLEQVTDLPVWAADEPAPAEAHRRLVELVRAATHRYATHGHGEETMLVHAATAPNAVLRILPVLPPALWPASLRAAWTAAAAVTSMYAPAEAVPCVPVGDLTAEEVFERALTHGDEHVIKLTDTALDVGDAAALAAAVRAMELTPPVG
ncbi:questin oxidase family protein [Kitasatospora sp. NPDC092948]|uniref:questin oxidase family protein n=1 Tax=Kitasatospora sp. NPDC092948 TaxID=3364088 RepID=UPI0037F12FC7